MGEESEKNANVARLILSFCIGEDKRNKRIFLNDQNFSDIISHKFGFSTIFFVRKHVGVERRGVLTEKFGRGS